MRQSSLSFVSVIVLGLFSQSSFAADLPVKARPVVASGYNWSGVYIGGNVGYGRTNSYWTNLESTTLFADGAPGDTFSNKMSGMIGGGQIGYNYQVAGWVFGVEALIDAAWLKGSHNSTSVFGAADDVFQSRINTLALGSGRFGYAWDNVLLYTKAGVAAANVKASVSDNVGPFTGSGNDNHWAFGPSLGVGFEYGITPNVSVGVEYDYARLGTNSYQIGGSTGSYLWQVELRNVNVVMAKLNYRFGWPR